MPRASSAKPILDRLERGLTRLLETLVVALMASLTSLVVAAVLFRKAGVALVWYDEIASVLLAWLTYYGAAYAALRRAHIGFPRLVERAPPRARRALLIVREVVVIGFFLVAGWAGWQVVRILEGTTLVSVPWLSAQVSQSVIPIGAVLFIVAELLSLPRAWSGLAEAGGAAGR